MRRLRLYMPYSGDKDRGDGIKSLFMPDQNGKILYIENLRILLTILIVIFLEEGYLIERI